MLWKRNGKKQGETSQQKSQTRPNNGSVLKQSYNHLQPPQERASNNARNNNQRRNRNCNFWGFDSRFNQIMDFDVRKNPQRYMQNQSFYNILGNEGEDPLAPNNWFIDNDTNNGIF